MMAAATDIHSLSRFRNDGLSFQPVVSTAPFILNFSLSFTFGDTQHTGTLSLRSVV
jgi:hypothetical protein